MLVLDREDFTQGARGGACRRAGAHLHLPEKRPATVYRNLVRARAAPEAQRGASPGTAGRNGGPTGPGVPGAGVVVADWTGATGAVATPGGAGA